MIDAGVAHAYYLASYRVHGRVIYEIAGPEPHAVDDHAGVCGYFVERGEGTSLHASSRGGEAVHQVREVHRHLDHGRHEGVAVRVALWQFVFVAPADSGNGPGPPRVGDPFAPDLRALAHEDAALRNTGQLFEDLVGPASPGEHTVFGVGLVRVPDRRRHARGRGLGQLGRYDRDVEAGLTHGDGRCQPDHTASHHYSIRKYQRYLLVGQTICPDEYLRDPERASV